MDFGPQHRSSGPHLAMTSSSQMTLDAFVSQLLTALDLMNERASAHTAILVRMNSQLSEIDITLQAINDSIDS